MNRRGTFHFSPSAQRSISLRQSACWVLRDREDMGKEKVAVCLVNEAQLGLYKQLGF